MGLKLHRYGWMFRFAFGFVALAFAGCSATEDPGGRGTRTEPLGPAFGAGGSAGIAGIGGAPAGGTGGSDVPDTSTIPDLDSLEPFNRDDTGMSGLPPEAIDGLRNGSGACSVAIVAPNEGTMFPSGLVPPILMWSMEEGAVQGGAYVHLFYEGTNNKVDYQFAVNGMVPGELQVPRDAWDQITIRSNQEKLQIELRVDVGGTVQACTTHLRVARGRMVGSIYYGSYKTPAPGGGGIMRLKLGDAQSELFMMSDAQMASPSSGPCVGCHSMSFQGTTMIASEHTYGYPLHEETYAWPMQDAPLPARGPVVDNAAFAALTPDGQLMLTMGNPDCTAESDTVPRSTNNMPFVAGPTVAKLVSVWDGKEVTAQGLQPDWYMWMPQFSPDGKQVVFNHAKPDPARPGFTDRRELAVMDYDAGTHTFSNLRVIVSKLGPEPGRDYLVGTAGGGTVTAGRNSCTARNPNDPNGVGAIPKGTCDGPCFPGWPMFTPDGRGVIFTLSSEPDFASAFPGRERMSMGHLYYVDIATGRSVKLENSMRVHIPEEAGFEFYPTVLPVAVGGYAWVFWTTRRTWGTRPGGIAASLGPIVDDPNNPLGMLFNLYLEVMGDPDAKKIWVSAVRMGSGGGDLSAPLVDPSYPAFYLQGQADFGNIRAFAALDPCRADGAGCSSGIDCCSGFCTNGVCGVPPPQQTCSGTRERCEVAADCCPPAAGEIANSCVAGFCDFILVE